MRISLAIGGRLADAGGWGSSRDAMHKYTQKSSGYKLRHRCGKYPQYNSNGDVSIVGDCETPKRDE